MKPSTTSKFPSSRAIILVVAVALIFAGSYFVQRTFDPPPKDQPQSYQRIVALSPSAVEIIYQLDLNNTLVGVSRFCRYPEDASTKPVVGGYLDLDFEALLRLEPDCVILLNEQHLLVERLDQLGIKTISLDHASTNGIIDSIDALGNTLGKQSEASVITQDILNRIEKVTAQSQSISTKPRVLVCINRDTTSAQPDRIIAAGDAGVHQEYITMAGGINAYQGSIAYPSISREKLIEMNPDIIIDLIPEDTWKSIGKAKLLQQWSHYHELRAVSRQQIYFVHENKHMIPGPRFADTLEVFAQAIQASLSPEKP